MRAGSGSEVSRTWTRSFKGRRETRQAKWRGEEHGVRPARRVDVSIVAGVLRTSWNDADRSVVLEDRRVHVADVRTARLPERGVELVVRHLRARQHLLEQPAV